MFCASTYYLNNFLPELSVIHEWDYSKNSFKTFANFSRIRKGTCNYHVLLIVTKTKVFLLLCFSPSNKLLTELIIKVCSLTKIVKNTSDLQRCHTRTHLCKVDNVAEKYCHAVKELGWNLLFVLEFFSHWKRKHLVKESVCSLLLLFQLQHCLGKLKGAVLNSSCHSVN